MIRFIRSLFAWELVGSMGANDYFQNTITGKRRVVKIATVHSPIDWDWVEGRADDLHRQAPRPPAPAPGPGSSAPTA